MPQCAMYTDDPSVYGFCLAKNAGGLPTMEEMLRVCAQAGEWEPDCRHSWVSGRMNSTDAFTLEQLLSACGAGNDDCTFELLDFRPAEDPLEQIGRCTQHAGRFGRDCAGHAVQRWWLEDPDEAEILRVASIPTPYPDRVGHWIGINVQCFSKGSCVGDPHVVMNCEKAVDHLIRNPGQCPARTKTPMHPGFRPENQAPRQPGMNGPGQPPSQPGTVIPPTPGGHPPGQGGHVPGGQPPPGQVGGP